MFGDDSYYGRLSLKVGGEMARSVLEIMDVRPVENVWWDEKCRWRDEWWNWELLKVNNAVENFGVR